MIRANEGYYDFIEEGDGYYELTDDVESFLVENSYIDSIFRLQDLKQRKLFLNSEVDSIFVDDIVHHILQINREDYGLDTKDRKPIKLYISSDGGDINAGFKLIDIIRSSKTPVYTINTGHQYSMAFLIGLAGKKRFATKNATFLMHDGSSLVYNSGTKLQDEIKFQSRLSDRIKNYVIEMSKITEKEYDSKLRMEWYLFADEAKAKGFTDYIIGENCDIDDIV